MPDLVTAWAALVDVPPDHGAVQVVPGSHKWGLLSQSDFFDTDLETTKAKIVEQTGRSFRADPCTLKAGEVSFHHCLTVHGSGPNTTSEPRRSLVLHLMPAHATYRAGSPDDTHVNAILLRERGGRDGDLFAGDLWPLLHPKKVSG